jgi:nucleoside-diphosphate-sugar epimerase
MKLPADRVAALRAFYEGRDVCVTGGAGFIGGHLVDALLSLGARIRIIDDLSNSSLDHLSTLLDLDPDRIRFVHASILDDDALAEACAGTAVILHLAAVGSVPRSIEDPRRAFAVNATGTLRVLEAARAARVQRVVLASSSSVYGDPPASPSGTTTDPAPKHEGMPLMPLSPYAASKAAAELLMASWAHAYGMSTVSLRYFNVFGPRQPADSPYAAVVARFARALLAGEPVTIFGDGTATRDFTFVSNAVLATLLAGSAPAPAGGFVGQAINVGAGARTSVLDLARRMAQAAGVALPPPNFVPARTGDVRHSLADIGRARAMLGYEPVASVAEGMVETIAWYRQALAGT